jgi:hypothetical protein
MILPQDSSLFRPCSTAETHAHKRVPSRRVSSLLSLPPSSEVGENGIEERALNVCLLLFSLFIGLSRGLQDLRRAGRRSLG